jgi:hypothetical protein
MKTKEDVEKEFDNFFPELLGKNYPLSVDGVFEAIDKMSPMIL